MAQIVGLTQEVIITQDKKNELLEESRFQVLFSQCYAKTVEEFSRHQRFRKENFVALNDLKQMSPDEEQKMRTVAGLIQNTFSGKGCDAWNQHFETARCLPILKSQLELFKGTEETPRRVSSLFPRKESDVDDFVQEFNSQEATPYLESQALNMLRKHSDDLVYCIKMYGCQNLRVQSVALEKLNDALLKLDFSSEKGVAVDEAFTLLEEILSKNPPSPILHRAMILLSYRLAMHVEAGHLNQKKNLSWNHLSNEGNLELAFWQKFPSTISQKDLLILANCVKPMAKQDISELLRLCPKNGGPLHFVIASYILAFSDEDEVGFLTLIDDLGLNSKHDLKLILLEHVAIHARHPRIQQSAMTQIALSLKQHVDSRPWAVEALRRIYEHNPPLAPEAFFILRLIYDTNSFQMRRYLRDFPMLKQEGVKISARDPNDLYFPSARILIGKILDVPPESIRTEHSLITLVASGKNSARMGRFFRSILKLIDSCPMNGSDGTTPYEAAIHVGDINAIASIQRNLPEVDINENFPLHQALLHQNVELVEYLLETEANPNLRDAKGNTPLHICAHIQEPNRKKCIEQLLEVGADINALNAKEQTLFDLAIVRCKPRLALDLLKRGARSGNVGMFTTPLSLILSLQTAKPKEIINVDALTYHEGLSLWHLISSNGKTVTNPKMKAFHDQEMEKDGNYKKIMDRVKPTDWKLLNDEAAVAKRVSSRPSDHLHSPIKGDSSDLQSADRFGNTALHAAIQASQRRTYKTFMSNRKGLNQQNWCGMTPAHFSILKGNRESLQALAEGNANFNIQDNAGLTPLHYAMFMRDKKAAMILIQHGADMHIRDQKDRTPLQYIFRDDLPTFYLAVPLNLSEIKRKNPLPLIEYLSYQSGENEREEIEEFSFLRTQVQFHAFTFDTLRDHLGNSLLRDAKKAADRAVIEFLTKHHPELTEEDVEVSPRKEEPLQSRVRDTFGNLPLHHSAAQGNLKAFEALLKENPDLKDTPNDQGNTPLHVAIAHGNDAVTNFLIEQNANVNLRNAHGETPLLLASQSDKTKLLEKLRKAGANLKAVDHQGKTALHKAVLAHHMGTICWLIATEDTLVNRSDLKGNHPLLELPKNSKIQNPSEVIKLFRDRGVSLRKLRNTRGETFLHVAAKRGNDTILLEILSSKQKRHLPAFDRVDSQQNTPLHLAVLRGHRFFIAKLESQLAPSLDLRNALQHTPLFSAVASGQFEIALQLIGSNLDVRALDGKTLIQVLLMHKLDQKGREVAEKLIELSPKMLMERDKSGNTILHILAQYNQIKLLDLILKNLIGTSQELDAFAKAKNSKGQTAVDLAKGDLKRRLQNVEVQELDSPQTPVSTPRKLRRKTSSFGLKSREST